MGPSFRSKTEHELGHQLRSAENTIGAPLRPPHSDLNLLRTALKELKERYPKRYQFYYEELRREKRGDILGEEEARRMKAWLEAMNSLDKYIHRHHKDTEAGTLREHQIKVFEALRNFFEQGGSKGYVKLPTGSGKTVIFIEMIEAMGLKTLVVVPRKILLEQTMDRMEEFADDLDVGRVYADAKEHGRQVTVITYDSLVSGVRNGFIDPNKYGLVILDEVHRGLSEKRKDVIGKFGHALQVGFTATPVFSAKKSVEQILPSCVFEMLIREAVEEGMLCSFISGVIQTNVDLSNVKLTSDGEYDEAELEMAVDIESRNRAAVDIYQEVAPNDKAVVYCAGVEHSKHVAQAYKNKGIMAAAVWGDMPKDEQKQALKDFASGKIKVLCNADLLIEGFDDKEVRLCINLRPTRSLVVSEQRGGRVLRLDPKNPEKISIIVDFLDHHGSTGLAGSVLFAEVAGGAIIEPSRKKKPSVMDTEPHEKELVDAENLSELLMKLKKINLEDAEITFEVEEIVRIIQRKNGSIESTESLLSLEDLIRETRAAGVKSHKDYQRLRKSHPNWPSNPGTVYKDQWKGWEMITGNVSNAEKEFLPLEDLIRETRAAGVRNKEAYKRFRKSHPKWPSYPGTVYKDQWKGWEMITGNIASIEKEFLPLEDLIREARAAGVKGRRDYMRLRKSHPNWPSNPDREYKDQWKGWEMITGK